MSPRRFWVLLLITLSGCGFRAPVNPGDGVFVVGYVDRAAFNSQVAEGAILGEIPEIRAAAIRLPRTALHRLWEYGLLRYQQPASTDTGLVQPIAESPIPQELNLQWYLDAVDVSTLRTLGDGTGVRVAVVDTGIDASHPDLAGRFLPGIDALSGGTLPPDQDFSMGTPHGTHVAGIIAARGQVQGLSPGVQLLPVRVFAPDYVGDFRAASAIIAASKEGASVFNLSFGGYTFSHVLYDAVTYALERGGWVIAAAGNSGDARPFYPAAFPGVVAVGASGVNGIRAPFSNYGPWVDLLAPGVFIYSTLPGARYGFLSGTSMAAPMASGIAAVLRSARTNLDAWGVSWLFRKDGVDAGKILRDYPYAPYGGCLRVQVLVDGTPKPAWLELKFDEGKAYAVSTDLLGQGKFFGIPQGDADLRVVVTSPGGPRIHWEPVHVYRSCSWAVPVRLNGI